MNSIWISCKVLVNIKNECGCINSSKWKSVMCMFQRWLSRFLYYNKIRFGSGSLERFMPVFLRVGIWIWPCSRTFQSRRKIIFHQTIHTFLMVEIESECIFSMDKNRKDSYHKNQNLMLNECESLVRRIIIFSCFSLRQSDIGHQQTLTLHFLYSVKRFNVHNSFVSCRVHDHICK